MGYNNVYLNTYLFQIRIATYYTQNPMEMYHIFKIQNNKKHFKSRTITCSFPDMIIKKAYF